MKMEYFQEFIVLAQYLNFSAAAEHLHITQPGLSRHMVVLEQHLDTKLLIRNTHYVTLTDAGKLFLKHVTKILDDYTELQSLMRLKKQGYDNKLRVGVPYYAMQDYLGVIPELFEARRPNVKLTYFASDPEGVLNALLQNEADIVILPRLSFPRAGDIRYFDLYEEALCVLVSVHDPLAHKTQCEIGDLKGLHLFTIGNTYFINTWNQTRALCRSAGFEPESPITMNQMESAILATRRGDGALVVGAHMRQHASREIACIPLVGEHCKRTISVMYKKTNYHSSIMPLIQVFQEAKIAGRLTPQGFKG